MIDIGQIEGAFVFGLGFNLLEDIVFDKNTGAVPVSYTHLTLPTNIAV